MECLTTLKTIYPNIRPLQLRLGCTLSSCQSMVCGTTFIIYYHSRNKLIDDLMHDCNFLSNYAIISQ